MPDDFSIRYVYALWAPKVSWPGFEQDFLWETHGKDIPLQRLLHLPEIFKEQQCTELEAMLYLSTASLAHPPATSYVNIYGWLFARWVKSKGQTDEDLQRAGLAPRELEPHEQEEMARLRRWIFKQQLEKVRKRLKDKPDAEPAAKTAESAETVGQQMAMM